MKPNDKIIEEKISQTWEAKYEKFVAVSSNWDDSQGLDVDSTKAFIRQLLEQKEREIVEKIEKTRKRTFTYMATPTIGADFTNVGGKKITAGKSYKATSSLSEEEIIYNQALDDIIKLIKTT